MNDTGASYPSYISDVGILKNYHDVNIALIELSYLKLRHKIRYRIVNVIGIIRVFLSFDAYVMISRITRGVYGFLLPPLSDLFDGAYPHVCDMDLAQLHYPSDR